MIRYSHQGFTIIELMLVVAISGALVVAVLVGSSTAINQQRYKDSVSSLKSFIQSQYDQVANTVNDRNGTQSCTATGVINATVAEDRGTGDCLVVGRVVTTGVNGTDLSAAAVVAYRSPLTVPASGASDTSDLLTYRLGAADLSRESSQVSWGAKIVKKSTTDPVGYTLLIVRAPLSGSIMTFSVEGATTNLNALVTTAGSATTTRNLCIRPSGFAFGKNLAVQIPAGASSQGDIQIPTESSNVCA